MKGVHVVKDKKGVGQDSKKVFGAALDPSSTTIPRILESCVVYLDGVGLELEGVFRKSGSLQLVKEYRSKIDKGRVKASSNNIKKNYDIRTDGENVDFSDVLDPHIVAGLLKLYIREYPEPLLTFELYDCFLAAVAIPDVTVKVPKVRQVLDMLPSANLMIVKYLVAFLTRVSAQSKINFMTPANLAIVFAPNLLRPPYEGDEGIGIMMEDTPFANQLLQLFINHYESLFSELKPIQTDTPKPPQNGGTSPSKVGKRVISGKPTPPKKPTSLTRQGSVPASLPALPALPAVPPYLPPTPALAASTGSISPPPRPSSPPPKPPSVLNRGSTSFSQEQPPPSHAPALPTGADTKTPTPPVVSPRNPLPRTPSLTNEGLHTPTPTPPPKPLLAHNPYRRSVKPLPTAPTPSSSLSTAKALDLAKRLPPPPMYAE